MRNGILVWNQHTHNYFGIWIGIVGVNKLVTIRRTERMQFLEKEMPQQLNRNQSQRMTPGPTCICHPFHIFIMCVGMWGVL